MSNIILTGLLKTKFKQQKVQIKTLKDQVHSLEEGSCINNLRSCGFTEVKEPTIYLSNSSKVN